MTLIRRASRSKPDPTPTSTPTCRSGSENVEQDVTEGRLGPPMARHWLRGASEESGFEVGVFFQFDAGNFRVERAADDRRRIEAEQNDAGGK